MAGGRGRVAGGDDQFAACCTDMRIREVGDELANGLRLETLPRVGEHHDLSGNERHQRVDHRWFASMLLKGSNGYAESFVSARALDRVIRRAIRADHDFQFVPRVIEREQVLNASTN